MPRFFAQAQQQVAADRRKHLQPQTMTGAGSSSVPMKSAGSSKESGPLTSPTATGGIQGALAQMEVNAAAAMARFKSFRNASGNVAKDDHPPHKDAPAGTPSSQRSEDLQDSPRYPRSASAPPPEAEAVAGFATGGRLAALDKAAARYLRSASAVDGTGTPWHHQLRGSNFEFISDLLDRPLVLLAVAAGCLAIGCSEYLWPLLLSLLSVKRLATLVGLACLLLAVWGWLLRATAFLHHQLSSFADTVPRMPRACEEMSEMLLEMKLMRNDLKSMRAKVSWLPGGE